MDGVEVKPNWEDEGATWKPPIEDTFNIATHDYFMCCEVCGGYWDKTASLGVNYFQMTKDGKEVWASYGMQLQYKNRKGENEVHRICLPCYWEKLTK